jgi:protein SCO1/2
MRGLLRGGSALVLLALVGSACGGGGAKGGNSSTGAAAVVSSTPGSTAPLKSGQLGGPLIVPPHTVAPQIVLHDQNGKVFRLSSLRGKAVFLTFVYAHCPDVCPLMVGNLHAALQQMTPAQAAKTQIVAVSVDPKGDTPAEVNTFIKAHDMTGRMEYLVGSKKQLTPVWQKYGVQVEASPENREQVGHSAFIYGITGQGSELALYPANFKPQWIVHDAPVLASA